MRIINLKIKIQGKRCDYKISTPKKSDSNPLTTKEKQALMAACSKVIEKVFIDHNKNKETFPL